MRRIIIVLIALDLSCADQVWANPPKRNDDFGTSKNATVSAADVPALRTWNDRLNTELDTMLNSAIRAFYPHTKYETYGVTLDFTVTRDRQIKDVRVIECSPSNLSPKLPLMLLQTINVQKKHLLIFPADVIYSSVKKRYTFSRQFGPLTSRIR